MGVCDFVFVLKRVSFIDASDDRSLVPKKEEREEEDADLYVRVRAQKFVSDIFYSLNEFEAFSEDSNVQRVSNVSILLYLLQRKCC